MSWQTVRSRATKTMAVVTLPAVVAVLALVDQGFPLARVDLNDGGVWLTNTSQLKLGRFNAQVEELDAGVVTSGSTFDVQQDGGDVLLLEPTGFSVVDPASVTQTTAVAVAGADVSMAAGTVAVAAGGDAWVRSVDQLDRLNVPQDPADVEVGDGGTVVVARTGVALAIGEDGEVTRVDLAQVPSTTPGGTLAGEGEIASVTAVGDEPVVLTGSTVRTLHGTVELDGDDLVLQEPGPQSSRVLVASRDALLEVPLDGGDVVEHPTTGEGRPARPVQVGSCAHAAWATPVGSYLELCDGTKPQVRNLQDMSAQDVLVFRVNHGIVVLNDTLRGRVWMPTQDTDLRTPDWQDVVPEDEPEEAEDESQTPQTTQELVTECTESSAAPVAADDEFGVRPGRTTILPVIDNDSSSDCGILVISTVDPLPPEFGTVEPIFGGRSLQVAVAPDASGTAEFTYTVDDGRGTSSPTTARVRLTARDGSLDDPPVQLRNGSLRVEAGGEADYQVLADFRDPDGDDLVLVGASADAAAGTVRFRQDGSLTFRADGGRLGRTPVTVLVSDGNHTVEGSLEVDVRPAGSLAPQIDPVHAVTYVGQPVTLRPLDAVRTTSQEAPRLASVDQVVGATVEADLAAGTFTFSAPRAQTYYVPFVVTAAPQQATGLARIDVLEWPEQARPPVAVRDVAYLPAGGEVTIDPLENDSDPAGGVLVLQDVEVPAGLGLHAAVLEHRYVQITADRTLTEPVSLRYVVSNGGEQAVGEIVVRPVAATGTSQPPVVRNVEASVRTGGVVTIPVLDTAYDPDGDRLTVQPTLAEPLGDGEGLLFVSGDVLRYQAPSTPMTARATFVVRDETGNETAATLTVRVHASDAATKAPPRPRDLEARVFAGDTVRIDVPLVGIDDDGDGVTLLGFAKPPERGRIVEVGADYLVYEAAQDDLGTVTFSYAVEDWTGQRAVADIRVGIAKRPTTAATVVARDDAVTVAPGRTVEVRVLANDVDSGGGDLRLSDELVTSPTEVSARVEGRRIIVRAPERDGILQISYTATNARGGSDTAVLTVTVTRDAPVLAPIAADVVVPPADTFELTEVAVNVLTLAQNPSGPLSDLEVSVPRSVAEVARVADDGRVVVTLVDHAQTLPYRLTNTTDPTGEAASWAFITVPALGFFPPTLRRGAPDLRVASGELLEISLDEQIKVAPGRAAQVADPLGVTATKSDGSGLVKDDTTLQFRSAPGYAGPASITLVVTDATRAGDPSAHTAPITLLIDVYAVDDHPPTFTPSMIDVAPGEAASVVDLRAFTTGPAGQSGTAEKYSYQLTAASPVGFTATVEGGILYVAAARDTPKGKTAQLPIRIGYGRSGSLDQTVDVRVVASKRPLAAVVDRTYTDGEEGKERRVDVLEGAYNPFPGEPLTVVGARVESGQGTVAVGEGTVSLRPAQGYIGQMVAVVRVRDATGDPDREVEGRVVLVVRGRPAVPIAPRVGEVRDRTVVLSWDAPDNRGAPIEEYRVVANPGGITRSCTSTTCTLDNLTNDVEYTFTVAARNAVGWSDPSAPSAPARPDAVPDAPATPTLEFGDNAVTARWTTPASRGSAISSYTLQISPSPQNGPASVSTSSTSFTFTGLRNGTAYTVQVRAHNRAPEPGPWSPWSTPTVPARVPDAPTVQAVPTDSQTGRVLDVTWVPGAENGDPVAEYEVTVDGPNGQTVVVPAGQTRWTFTNARTGFPYQVSVKARNKAGWGAAGTTTASTFGLPTEPTSLTATSLAGQGAIRLSWSGADGNGAQITDYVVRMPDGSERSVGRGEQWVAEGLQGRDEPYTFQVRSVNQAGSSGWSPAASAPATTPPGQPAVAEPVVATAGTAGRPTALRISWSAAAANGGGNLRYRWSVQADTGQRADGTGGPGQTIDVSGWSWRWQGTRVTVTVVAETTIDGRTFSGSPGQSSAVLTWGAVPGKVGGLTLTPNSTDAPTQLTAAWSAPDSGGLSMTYQVCWFVDGNPVGCDDENGTTRTRRMRDLGNPASGSTVAVVVTARNEKGAGPASNAAEFTVP